jgi:hypothetical protein
MEWLNLYVDVSVAIADFALLDVLIWNQLTFTALKKEYMLIDGNRDVINVINDINEI